MKCLNRLIVRFDGSELKISEGTLCQKMADSSASSTLLILILDKLSRRRKIRLEKVHLMHSGANPYDFL